MKKSKVGLVPLLMLLLAVVAAGCSYSSYPPSSYPSRPYYGSAYGYGNRYVRPPRVVVVRPAPRVVYRTVQPRPATSPAVRRGYDTRENGVRSNRTYRSGSAARSRSYGPR